MERVIVSIKIQGMNGTKDVEVPTNVAVQELAELIISSYQGLVYSGINNGSIKIKADPPGRILNRAETLADAGVWDGANLTILY